MDIKVETDSNGMVELSGNAKTKAEAEQAVKLAKSVKGVTGVKDDIKIAN
jgi:hyperosmotically inducible periplasmic protein